VERLAVTHKNSMAGKIMVAGLGFRAGANVASLRSALQVAISASHGAAGNLPVLTALATAEDKANHSAFTQLAAELALQVVAIPLGKLTEMAGQIETLSATTRVTLISHVPLRYGARSLAESSALIAAGPGAHLLAPRAVSADRMATAAIAENFNL
jgi:cobalt-precorrin 5A hydrolase